MSNDNEPYSGYSVLASYLKDREAWSFYGFLKSHRNVIVNSPPFSEKWEGLENAWATRFLRAVQEIIPNNYKALGIKVKSECLNQGLKLYWDEIVRERKELSVENIHVTGSLDLLGKVGKYNIQKLGSKYPENPKPGDGCPKSLEQPTLGKRRNTSHCEEENDQTEQNILSETKRTKTTIVDDHKGKTDIVEDHTDEIEDNENIEFDLDSLIRSLQQELIYEWKVGNINVSQKFREYQQEVLKKLKTTKLTWHNTYEILALSSIIVLCRSCPYPNYFTNEEWQMITQTNPHTIHEQVIPASASIALHEAVVKHLSGQDSYMHADETPMSRAVARTFNELRENVPDLAPQKTSEDEHCCQYLHPYIRPIFLKKYKDYEVQLNRAIKGTRQRPDLSCTVDTVPLLNSEVKPLGSSTLKKKKDFAKVNLRARKTINQLLTLKGGPGKTAMLLNFGDIVQTYFMDLQFDGLYRSWPFLTTKLVIDEPSLPLIESNIAHFVALERCVGELAKDYKSRRVPFTPPLQIRYMRSIPDSPQIRNMLGL
ncbi:hypothetical protein G9A89_010082 [Geosiphon pyriformis]|nr:hypothetical protein G9A89_010082 [Geosiphon pyriformis]